MKKAKKERKYTLSGQMTAIFIGLLVFILMTVFIAILNGIWLDNAAILRIDDNVCASIAWFFIVKTIKEKKAANFG